MKTEILCVCVCVVARFAFFSSSSLLSPFHRCFVATYVCACGAHSQKHCSLSLFLSTAQTNKARKIGVVDKKGAQKNWKHSRHAHTPRSYFLNFCTPTELCVCARGKRKFFFFSLSRRTHTHISLLFCCSMADVVRWSVEHAEAHGRGGGEGSAALSPHPIHQLTVIFIMHVTALTPFITHFRQCLTNVEQNIRFIDASVLATPCVRFIIGGDASVPHMAGHHRFMAAARDLCDRRGWSSVEWAPIGPPMLHVVDWVLRSCGVDTPHILTLSDAVEWRTTIPVSSLAAVLGADPACRGEAVTFTHAAAAERSTEFPSTAAADVSRWLTSLSSEEGEGDVLCVEDGAATEGDNETLRVPRGSSGAVIALTRVQVWHYHHPTLCTLRWAHEHLLPACSPSVGEYHKKCLRLKEVRARGASMGVGTWVHRGFVPPILHVHHSDKFEWVERGLLCMDTTDDATTTPVFTSTPAWGTAGAEGAAVADYTPAVVHRKDTPRWTNTALLGPTDLDRAFHELDCAESVAFSGLAPHAADALRMPGMKHVRVIVGTKAHADSAHHILLHEHGIWCRSAHMGRRRGSNASDILRVCHAETAESFHLTPASYRTPEAENAFGAPPFPYQYVVVEFPAGVMDALLLWRHMASASRLHVLGVNGADVVSPPFLSLYQYFVAEFVGPTAVLLRRMDDVSPPDNDALAQACEEIHIHRSRAPSSSREF